MKIRFDSTGEELDIPDDAVGEYAAKGGYSFQPGTPIPVHQADGSIAPIPIEQYWAQSQQYKPATQQDVASFAQQQHIAEEQQKDIAFGDHIANQGRAILEATARGVTLGASDWVQTQLGVDATGLKERAERNPISAGIGEAVGMIAPAILTGGASVEATGVRAIARATPVAIVDSIGRGVERKIASAIGEGFAARLAAGTARVATEGAIAGIGGEISARALNDQQLLDPDTLSEYLRAAGHGAILGGALGLGGGLIGETVGAGFSAARRAFKPAEIPEALQRAQYADAVEALKTKQELSRVHEDSLLSGYKTAETAAETRLTAAQAADYDGAVRATQQKYDLLKIEDFPELEKAAQKTRSAAEASAPRTEPVTSAAGRPAHSPLESLGRAVRTDAEALGVSKADAATAWQRIERGKTAFDSLETETNAATTRIAAKLDELEKVGTHAEEAVDLSMRNDAISKALATDRTAPPSPMFLKAMQEQHAKMREAVASFGKDPDPQIKSYAHKLDKFLTKNEEDLNAVAQKATKHDRADAFAIVDRSNRIVGRVRAKLGDRSNLGIGTFSETLAGLYEDTRQLLRNPTVVGEGAAAINSRAKASYSDLFDVRNGYRKTLLAEDMGGARTLSGFDTVDRADPRKIKSLLATIDGPESQLGLEVVGRSIDSQKRLMQHFADDIKPGPAALGNIKRFQTLADEIADEIVAHRSRMQLSKEYASNVAPALKELETAEGALTKAQTKAAERFQLEQARIQAELQRELAKAETFKAKELDRAQSGLENAQERSARAEMRMQDREAARAAQLDAAQARAEEKAARLAEKAQGGMVGTILESLAPAVGAATGGLFGFAAGQLVSRMSTPIVKALARAGLTGALQTSERMAGYRTALSIGKQVETATTAIADFLHAAGPVRGAAKLLASEFPRDSSAEFAAAQQRTIRAAQAGDPAAVVLMGALPQRGARVLLRPDLDRVPLVPPLVQRKFLRSYRAAQNPIGTLQRVAQGVATPEEIDTLKQIYPNIYLRAQQGVMAHVATLTKPPTMHAQRALSQFMGAPLHFTVSPEFVRFAQSAYQQAPQGVEGTRPLDSEPGKPPTASKTVAASYTPSQRLENGLAK